MASTPNNPQQLNPYGVAGNPNSGGMQDTSSALKGDDLTGQFTANWDAYQTEQKRIAAEQEAATKKAAEKAAADAAAAAAAAKKPTRNVLAGYMYPGANAVSYTTGGGHDFGPTSSNSYASAPAPFPAMSIATGTGDPPWHRAPSLGQ